jgi:hypothetical protein
MDVSQSVVVSSNLTVEILGVCSILVNCARVGVLSKYSVMSSKVAKWEVIVCAYVVSLCLLLAVILSEEMLLLVSVVSQSEVLTSSVVVVVTLSLTIGAEVIISVETKKVHVVSENVVVSSKMIVSQSVVVSSNVRVGILRVCPTVVSCTRLEVSSEFRVLASTEEVKSLAAVESKFVELTSCVVVVVSVSLTVG